MRRFARAVDRSGQNRAGWSNEEYDRLYATYRRTLDRAETDRIAVQLLKLLNEELPGYATYESPALMAFASGLSEFALAVMNLNAFLYVN